MQTTVTVRDCEAILRSGKPLVQVQTWLKKLLSSENNFETFCRLCLPHAFTKPFGEFHKEIVLDFMSDGDSVVAAPRGHGKSTLIGLGYVIWNVLYQKEKYIVYTSQNHSKSEAFLEPIKQELKNNQMIEFIYGKGNIGLAKDEEGRDRQDCFDYNGCRIQALSFEKNIRGLKYGSIRPTLIILDDVEDDQRVLNPELRRKDQDKLNKQIVPAVDPVKGKIKMIGTILHHDSLLSKRLRLYDGKIYRAILEDGSPLFPGLYSLEKLEERKRVMGSSSFESEYMNNPVDDTASIIKRDWVMQAFDDSLSFTDDISLKKYDSKYQGVDFAFSDRLVADKSAYVGLGKIDGHYEIIQCILKKGLTITQQFDYIQMIQGMVGYDDNALEENSIRSMSNELMKYDFPFTLYWTAANDSAKQKDFGTEFEGKRHTVGKLAMINRLATQFENKRIKIPYKTETDKRIAHQIMDECTTFARQDGKLVETGVHSDIAIALAYALERAEMDKFEFAMVIG